MKIDNLKSTLPFSAVVDNLYLQGDIAATKSISQLITNLAVDFLEDSDNSENNIKFNRDSMIQFTRDDFDDVFFIVNYIVEVDIEKDTLGSGEPTISYHNQHIEIYEIRFNLYESSFDLTYNDKVKDLIIDKIDSLILI